MAVGFNPIFASMRHDAPDASAAPAGGRGSGDGDFWGDDGFSFGDILDLINPLQHIPVVSTLYRAATGDDIAAGPRILGGALFGGVPGFLASLADSVVTQTTGSDVGAHVMALFDGGTNGETPPAGPRLAAAEMAPTAVAARTAVGADPAPVSEPADDAGTTTPAWLARTPVARGDFVTLAGRYGEPPSPRQAIEALGKALDKYEAMGSDVDTGAPASRRDEPGAARLDTLI